MAARLNEAEGHEGAAQAVPTLALRGGLFGEFVDFHLLPALLADFDGTPRSAAVGPWVELLVEPLLLDVHRMLAMPPSGTSTGPTTNRCKPLSRLYCWR